MKTKSLKCVFCGTEFPPEEPGLCRKCGSPLLVCYDQGELESRSMENWQDVSRQGLWRYFPMLPVQNPENIVTLGEGGTPLVEAENLAGEMNVGELWIKNEFCNPTASFKDRPTSVGISVAREQGVKTVAIASTGNAGVSAAAYAAKCGMQCLVCAPAKTSSGKVAQLLAYGAKVFFHQGNYSDCFGLVRKACELYGYANLTSTYVNPYTVEADRTVAYELFEQMGGRVPDWITVPVGTGPLLSGVFRGFQELKAMGLVSRLPRMVAVQAERCSPIVKGFLRPDGAVQAAVQLEETMAGGIADQLTGYEGDGEYTIRQVRQSNGVCVALTEEEIYQAWLELCRKEGIFAEPTGACAVGAVTKLRQQGVIGPQDCVVALVTGHGLKAPAMTEALKERAISIEKADELKI